MFLYAQCVISPYGESEDMLQDHVIKMLEQLGSNCTSVSQVIRGHDKAVHWAIQDGIDHYHGIHECSDAQKVAKLTVYNYMCVCCIHACACTYIIYILYYVATA